MEERRAPLASMEDLSVLGTPIDTPLVTPCPSPRTSKRWSHLSHRSSLGTIVDEEEEQETITNSQHVNKPKESLMNGDGFGENETSEFIQEDEPLLLEEKSLLVHQRTKPSKIKPRVSENLQGTSQSPHRVPALLPSCLLYTSAAADE